MKGEIKDHGKYEGKGWGRGRGAETAESNYQIDPGRNCMDRGVNGKRNRQGRCRESSQCRCCFLLRPLLAQVCCFPKEAGSRRGISLVPAHTECLFRPVLLLLSAAWAKAAVETEVQEGYRTMVVSRGGWLENGAKEGLEGTGEGWELDVQFQEGGHGKERWSMCDAIQSSLFPLPHMHRAWFWLASQEQLEPTVASHGQVPKIHVQTHNSKQTKTHIHDTCKWTNLAVSTHVRLLSASLYLMKSSHLIENKY